MSILKRIGDFFKGLLNFPGLEDLKEAVLSGIMYVLYQGSTEPGTTITNVEIMDSLIRIGMLIIIWYGVAKIVTNVLWRFLFGRKLEWKIGILEPFLGRLKPVYAQRISEMTDAEIEEKTERYLSSLNKVTKKITKDDTRRCCRMNFVKNLAAKMNVNKKTNAAMATLGALAISTGGYFVSDSVGIVQQVYSTMGVSPSEVLAATAVAGVALVIPGVLGSGRQTKEQFESMLEVKKQKRLEVKKAKAEGVPLKTLEERAAIYATKNNVSEKLANQIILEQDAKAREAAKVKMAAVENNIVAKIAKKQKVSEEMARQIRLDQVKLANAKPLIK